MIKKLLSDTLKNPEGKFSRKSITLFVAMFAALSYEFIVPVVFSLLDIEYIHKEYVFKSLLIFSELLLFGTIADKKIKGGI